MMKPWLDWNAAKNESLKRERGIGFEDVETAVEQGGIVGDFPHPNAERYPNQRVLIVEIDGYACIVSYVLDGDARFLKTVYRSRKAQRLKDLEEPREENT